MADLIVPFALGVSCTLFVQAFLVAWNMRPVVPKETDPVDAENVIRIQKWKDRRRDTDETFGRRA